MSFVLQLPGPTKKPGTVMVEVTDSRELVIHNYCSESDEAVAALGGTPSPVYLIAAFDEILRDKGVESEYLQSTICTNLMKKVIQLDSPLFISFFPENVTRDYLANLNELGLIELLLEMGADPNVPIGDFGEARPLLLMAKCANFSAIKSLVEHGADVTFDQNTSLQFLIYKIIDSPRHREEIYRIFEYLLDHGADEGPLGWVLYDAVLSQDTKLVDILFRYGADPFWLEQTAFKAALDEGYEPIINRFIEEFKLYEKRGYVRTTFPEQER
jgi:hypothetical protein